MSKPNCWSQFNREELVALLDRTGRRWPPSGTDESEALERDLTDIGGELNRRAHA